MFDIGTVNTLFALINFHGVCVMRLFAIAGIWAGMVGAAFPAEAVTLTLADFDGTNLGTAEAPLSVSAIGSGSCTNFLAGGSASGSALCAVDNDTAAGGTAELTFSDVDLRDGNVLSFSLAADAGAGDFDAPGNANGDQVLVTAGGVLLAQFDGVQGTDTIALSGGVATGPSIVAATFVDFIVDTTGLGLGNSETLTFSFLTTSGQERIGVDEVNLTVTPLPPAIVLSLVAFLGLGLMRRQACA